ncbi:MAG: transcriptional repressor [Thermoanaerobaculaceae bacterium]|nr:transcriptional repressor [Thermoanaerobaculaceae bacterium]NLH11558.1 transcriptional repressor [Holophagae bacterium]
MRHDPADLLRRHGIQVTAQRLAVLAAVARRPHGTADDVVQAVRAEIGVISRQAVYDALAILTERGLIRRIQPAWSPARFENRTGDNHHHVICRDCGRVVDVDCAIGVAPCLTPADDGGFQIDEAEVIFWGRCPQCRAHATVRPPVAVATGAGPGVSSPNDDTPHARATAHERADPRKGDIPCPQAPARARQRADDPEER